MAGHAELAEDMVQEAFIKAWLNLPRFRGECSFRSWLGRIVTNTTIDYLRRNAATVILDEDVPSATASPQALAMQAESREQIRRAVLSLPAQSRAALVLREYEDLSYKEIAQVLDIPIGTVMSRLNYARGRLRELLEPQLPG
jgi:RNA polymerase sigma-70 factor, ECF subfamily